MFIPQIVIKKKPTKKKPLSTTAVKNKQKSQELLKYFIKNKNKLTKAEKLAPNLIN